VANVKPTLIVQFVKQTGRFDKADLFGLHLYPSRFHRNDSLLRTLASALAPAYSRVCIAELATALDSRIFWRFYPMVSIFIVYFWESLKSG
jgi:hypothetical protein